MPPGGMIRPRTRPRGASSWRLRAARSPNAGARWLRYQTRPLRRLQRHRRRPALTVKPIRLPMLWDRAGAPVMATKRVDPRRTLVGCLHPSRARPLVSQTLLAVSTEAWPPNSLAPGLALRHRPLRRFIRRSSRRPLRPVEHPCLWPPQRHPRWQISSVRSPCMAPWVQRRRRAIDLRTSGAVNGTKPNAPDSPIRRGACLASPRPSGPHSSRACVIGEDASLTKPSTGACPTRRVGKRRRKRTHKRENKRQFGLAGTAICFPHSRDCTSASPVPRDNLCPTDSGTNFCVGPCRCGPHCSDVRRIVCRAWIRAVLAGRPVTGFMRSWREPWQLVSATRPRSRNCRRGYLLL